jgi:hypothetical protein
MPGHDIATSTTLSAEAVTVRYGFVTSLEERSGYLAIEHCQ